MKIAIIGGKIKGLDAAYLSKKAKWKVILIDKDDYIPARGLCDEFYKLDIMSEGSRFVEIIKQVDLIIPAVDDEIILDYLEQVAVKNKIPLAFHAFSFYMTSSKIKLNSLLKEQGIPLPNYYPKCNLPLIIKFSDLNVKESVVKIHTIEELSEFLTKDKKQNNYNWIAQEFIEGEQYSLQVTGFNGELKNYHIMCQEVNEMYECRRIMVPVKFTPDFKKQIKSIAEKITKYINLFGILNIEVVKNKGLLKVINIDAGLPVLKSIAIYNSARANLIKDLYGVFVDKGYLDFNKADSYNYYVTCEVIGVENHKLKIFSENKLKNSGPLYFKENFFGADEAITNYSENKDNWIALIIIKEINAIKAHKKRCNILLNIKNNMKNFKQVSFDLK